MINMLYQILISKLFLFYVILFICVVLIKKLLRVNVAINTIWFSEDGIISEYAIENLLALSNDIKNSPYKKNYQLYFWTDIKKLNPNTRKAFQRYGIKIKDYRNVNPQDAISKTALQWIAELIAMGNANNKLFYLLAADLFRFYLLFKEFPATYRHSYVIYMDCNDIYFNKIPNPYNFCNLSGIAFHFVQFNYAEFNIFQKLTNCIDVSQKLLTNDLIVVKNKRDPMYDHIFESYCNNLAAIYPVNDGIIEILKKTTNEISFLDDDMLCIVIFTTTHMVNVLYAHGEDGNTISLLSFADKTLKTTVLDEIQDVSAYIEFVRDYGKGMTCFDRENIEMTTANMQKNTEHRQFWYDLFKERYHQKLCMMQSSSMKNRIKKMKTEFNKKLFPLKYFTKEFWQTWLLPADYMHSHEIKHRDEFFRRAFVILTFNGISGDYAEFGSCGGMTFNLAHKNSRKLGYNCKLWTFDSFQGLPEPADPKDAHPVWKKGAMSNSIDEFKWICEQNGISLNDYKIVEGFYKNTIDNPLYDKELPHDISIAYIDCDMYSSTVSVLNFLNPRMKHGMIVAFDDYFCYSASTISGERRALIEFMANDDRFHFLPFHQFCWGGMSFILEDKKLIL